MIRKAERPGRTSRRQHPSSIFRNKTTHSSKLPDGGTTISILPAMAFRHWLRAGESAGIFLTHWAPSQFWAELLRATKMGLDRDTSPFWAKGFGVAGTLAIRISSVEMSRSAAKPT